MKQKVILAVFATLLTLFGLLAFREFGANHGYYTNMISEVSNRMIFIVGLIISSVFAYYVTSQKVSMKNFLMALFVGIFLFGSLQIMIKDDFYGSGLLLFFINVAIVFSIGIFFITGALAFGSEISKKVFKLGSENLTNVFLSFGLGLAVILSIISLLIGFAIFYSSITWIIFLFLGYVIYKKRDYLKNVSDMLMNPIHSINLNSNVGIFFFVLLVISSLYYFYGFNLAFIPYPTAWDANHAYMYLPKVRSLNNGLIRENNAGVSPISLWMSYIAIFFSLIKPISSWFWLTPDTIAVEMNFLSAIFVLLFGVALVSEVVNYFSDSDQKVEFDKQYFVGFGRMGLLLWLTSGMGAFLVFIDNKTDLGVLSLIALALLSGFTVINHIQKPEIHSSNYMRYVVLSGFFFACAVMAKPTALLDVLGFGLLLTYLWTGILLLAAGFFIAVGTVALLQVVGVSEFLSTRIGIPFLTIGGIFAMVDIFLKSAKKELKSVYLIFVRGVTIIATMLLVRSPYMIADAIINSKSVDKWLKPIFFSVNIQKNKASDRVLLASNVELAQLTSPTVEVVPVSDTNINETSNSQVLSCKSKVSGLTGAALYSGTKEFEIGKNEDVGRYVGYGWKEFQDSFLNYLPISANSCISFNSSVRALCYSYDAVENFDIKALRTLLTEIGPDSKAGIVLSGVLNSDKVRLYPIVDGNKINPLEFQDEIKKIVGFLGDSVIRTTDDTLLVPYRYIIPFNIVFNRSLQNLSSYYTDIGFIWLFMMFGLILSLIYSSINYNKKLFALSMVATILRGIWRVIGGGILWYGIGLIIRTIIVNVSFLYNIQRDLRDENSKILFRVVIFVFLARTVLQFLMNFIRISSQTGSGPFVWYKTTNGKTVTFNSGSNYVAKEVIDYKFSSQDVFDLQFPFYNPFINMVKDRKNEDGIFIAGTYLHYFLPNQKNITFDGMLDQFWKRGSDGDMCKMYARLKDKKIKHLVIDQNIGSVVMGDGNKSLFNRFFAKIDPVTNKIAEDGAIMMLFKLIDAGYLKYVYSNNLGTKYAFTLTDDQIKQFIPSAANDLYLGKAKLALARYFLSEQDYINIIANIFTNRIMDGKAISDLADVFGRDINVNSVENVVFEYVTTKNTEKFQQGMDKITEDERYIAVTFLNIYNILRTNSEEGKQQYQQFLQQILNQSLGNSSQLMVFELQ